MVTTAQPQAKSITLENDRLQLVVRPDLGGRIDQFLDRISGRDWVWHGSDYSSTETRNLEMGASFDDHWQGGWDEVFPNDMAQQFAGRNLVDHGELWSQPWQITDQSPFRLSLRYTCQTVPVLVEKVLTLHETEPALQIQYRLQNLSDQSLPFLLKLHAALAIRPGDRMLLPNCLIQPVTLDFSKMIGRNQTTQFPWALAADGTPIDLRQLPAPDSQLQEFYYALDLETGTCGIQEPLGTALLMQFDTADFPYVWAFQSYGGWRDHYVLVMEPCTTMPYDLEEAVRNQTVAMLQPQQMQQRSLTIRIDPEQTGDSSQNTELIVKG